MEAGTYKLHQADRGFGVNVSTEEVTQAKYYTLTLTLYNRVYWLEFNRKVKQES